MKHSSIHKEIEGKVDKSCKYVPVYFIVLEIVSKDN